MPKPVAPSLPIPAELSLSSIVLAVSLYQEKYGEPPNGVVGQEEQVQKLIGQGLDVSRLDTISVAGFPPRAWLVYGTKGFVYSITND